MANETIKQREERKQMYLAQVIRHSKGVENLEEILKEASDKWEKANKK